MQTKSPKICVSVQNREVVGLRRDTERAIASGADYVEARFDAIAAQSRAGLHLNVGEAFKRAVPFGGNMVFTLRSVQQGGRFSGDLDDTQLTLKLLASGRPMLLDVEYAFAQQRPGFVDGIRASGVQVLISHHDFNETPSDSKLLETLDGMMLHSNNVKIVTMAKIPQDAFRMIALYRKVDPSYGINLISFAMGNLGRVSRLASGLANSSPFTFAALGEAVAPGQLTLSEMRDIYSQPQRVQEILRILRQ